MVLAAALRDGLVEALGLGCASLRAYELLHVGDVQPGVPDVQRGHRREPADRLPVLTDERADDLVAPLGLEVVLAAGDRHARRQALDVPFPRSGKGLVEVDEVEDQLALSRREGAEVRQMRIPAELDTDPRLRRPGQVPGHHVRRAAKEGERRLRHAGVADRHEVGIAHGRLLLEQRNGIRPVGALLPCGVG